MNATNTMNEALRTALAEKGWDPDKVTWGRRVSGSPNGVRIERNGETRYFDGPFVAIRGDDQIAIVRWG